MIFFGLRGLLPVNQSGTGFSEEHKVSIVNVDHRHMRCTIGQWKPGRGIALFPGSTVPSNNHSNPYISRAKRRGGFGTNQLMLGRYAHRKGQHGIGRRTGHKAFRQEGFFPVWRTKDDLDDFVDMNIQGRAPRPIVWDNIHCGWSNGPSSADFTSAGCQVVAGFPRCEKRGNAPNTGPWKKFYDNAYGISQKKFFYGLFDGLETQRIAELNGEDLYQNLRFNSEGELVKIMQTRLNSKGFNVGTPDGEFGPDTLEGLMAFQAQEIGESSDDGILGPMTADALGMKLPKLGETLDDIDDVIVTVDTAEHDDEPVADTLRPDMYYLDDDGEVEEDVTPAVADPKMITVSNTTERGWKFYFATDEMETKIPIGRRLRYGSNKGLGLRTEQDAARLPGGQYEPDDHKDKYGLWTYFIWPTAVGESFGGYYNCFNCYDRAKFTYGFYQLAAHTPNENLIVYFRRILKLDDASRYFPDLKLINGKVHQVSDRTTKNLEDPHTDGLLRHFMNYLNPSASTIDDEEVVNVARLIFWSQENPQLYDMQVKLAVDIAKSKLKRAIQKGVHLQGRPVWHAIWVSDNLHQGRAKYTQLKSALNSANVDRAMSTVGISEKYPNRIKVVRASIKRLEDRRVFDSISFGDGEFDI